MYVKDTPPAKKPDYRNYQNQVIKNQSKPKSKRNYIDIQTEQDKIRENQILNQQSSTINLKLLTKKSGFKSNKLDSDSNILIKGNVYPEKIENFDVDDEDYDLIQNVFGNKKKVIKEKSDSDYSILNQKIIKEFKNPPKLVKRSSSCDKIKAIKNFQSRNQKFPSNDPAPLIKVNLENDNVRTNRAKNQDFIKPYAKELSDLEQSKFKESKYRILKEKYQEETIKAKSKAEESAFLEDVYSKKIKDILKSELQPIIDQNKEIQKNSNFFDYLQYKKFTFRSKRDVGSFLYKIQNLYDEEFFHDLLNQNFSRSKNLIQKAIIQVIESKHKNLDSLINKYENQDFKPKNVKSDDLITESDLNNMIDEFIDDKNSKSKCVDKKHNNKLKTVKKESDSSEKEDEFSDSNKQSDIKRHNYKFTNNNVKIFKLINRASKKSDVVNFDLNIEKNPKSGYFPTWNYDIRDYLHDVYENRHRYMIYLNMIKDDQNVDHKEPDFTSSFLKEDKSDLYIRNLTVYCLKFQKFYNEDEQIAFFRDKISKIKNLKHSIMFYNSSLDNDRSILLYIRFNSGKKLPKDIFDQYDITRISYVYLNEKEIFEITEDQDLFIAIHDSEELILQKYEKKGNQILEKKKRK